MAAARKTTTARTTRETRVTSRASTAQDATAAPTPSGIGLAEVVGIVTTLLLIAAILAIDYSNAKQLGAGIFFS
jgi:hypothetical protein